MVRGLLVLNSSYTGARDLWWPRDPKATRGYNIFRAFDAPYNFVKLNTQGPVPGQFYRDKTELLEHAHTVQPTDWIDQGVNGMQCFRIPHTPFSGVVKGKPVVASSPDDIRVDVTYPDGTVQCVRPGLVSGVDQTIFLPVGVSLTPDGSVTNSPIIDFTTAVSFVAVYNTLVNFVDISVNMLRTYYRVVPVGDRGELHSVNDPNIETVDSMQIDRMNYIWREAVRRNAWVFEQIAEPAYLLFRRRAGETCGCTSTETGTPRTRCEVCFETGIVGGYYGPYDFPYIPPDTAIQRTLDEGGVKVERSSRSYLGPTPIVQDGDLLVRRNGERLVISGVDYIQPGGVLLQQEFDVELLPGGDTRYLIPIAAPERPVIYNPVVSADPLDGIGGAEPIYEATTVPGQIWENPDKQVGRSVVFGRIKG